MKKIFWKACLYSPAAVLLYFIIYVTGTGFESPEETRLLLLTVLAGVLGGFFHVYIVIWEKNKKVDMPFSLVIKYCFIYRTPIAMAFTILCYFWLFHFFLLIRERIPPLAPVSVVTIGLLIGSLSYWLVEFLVKVLGVILRANEPTEEYYQRKKLYKLPSGGDIMDTNNDEKKEVQEVQQKSVSLKERIKSADGDWEWIKLMLLGFFLLIIPFILVFFIIDFWPIKDTSNAWTTSTMILNFQLSFPLRMLLLVLLAGALGSYIHVATSFSYHIAKRDYEPHWYWWYWMRLPIGAALALMFIMIIEGGIFITTTGTNHANPVTTIGIAALIGLFSRHALEKLRDIFDVIFNPREKKDDK
ncbi:MAG: hypothetical protein JSV88_20955 [Candidatus Aminicenantes bacterium]|nr:MAG: hypothetical protein JSV88_20955 [Candidatus Aminicenantes bacterium]